MEERNMTELMQLSLKDQMQKLKPMQVKQKMKNLATKNKKDISYLNSPEYLRAPTADELIEMMDWAIDYKRANKQASKREVRKATQEHFKIRIFRSGKLTK